MPNIIYTDAFLTDMLMVESSRIEAAIFDAIDLLPYMPILGARTSHASVVSAYGEGVRVISVTPFDVVYRILPEGDFLILGLVFGRSVH